MRNTIYIPPKVRHKYKGMMYYTDFERHVGRALPKAHRAVISRLESLRFHGKAVRAVITEAPDGRSTRSYHTPLHDLLLEYARWLIDTVFRDPELDEDPMICCIGRHGHHTRSMIRRGLGYKVMRANVVNWSRRA
ncbi:MAG: hypothetical protein K2M94_01360, partial [Paramuribaculum sp.]|nr:hypothetical protein [Paramuribaculum sp.]